MTEPHFYRCHRDTTNQWHSRLKVLLWPRINLDSFNPAFTFICDKNEYSVVCWSLMAEPTHNVALSWNSVDKRKLGGEEGWWRRVIFWFTQQQCPSGQSLKIFLCRHKAYLRVKRAGISSGVPKGPEEVFNGSVLLLRPSLLQPLHWSPELSQNCFVGTAPQKRQWKSK